VFLKVIFSLFILLPVIVLEVKNVIQDKEKDEYV